MRSGLKAISEIGAVGCILTEDPAYYRRFGFVQSPESAPPGEPSEFFMVKLLGGRLPTGSIHLHEAFRSAVQQGDSLSGTPGTTEARVVLDFHPMTTQQPPEPVTLYTYAMSPYAAKVHCFLLYKRVRFECFYINPLRVKHDLPVGRQIPVLTIGDESRADSTPIGLWLDERFPELPRLLPESGDERERLLKIDDWITHCLIPGSFRFFPGEGLDRWLNGWRLSYVMNRTARGGLPLMLRATWPLFIQRVAFVRRLLEMADDGLPLQESKRKLYHQFIAHLDAGPFLAGRPVPSLADLAAYPQFALFYLTGFRGSEDILEYPEIMSWLRRMGSYVSGTPPLVPASVRKRELP